MPKQGWCPDAHRACAGPLLQAQETVERDTNVKKDKREKEKKEKRLRHHHGSAAICENQF